MLGHFGGWSWAKMGRFWPLLPQSSYLHADDSDNAVLLGKLRKNTKLEIHNLGLDVGDPRNP